MKNRIKDGYFYVDNVKNGLKVIKLCKIKEDILYLDYLDKYSR